MRSSSRISTVNVNGATNAARFANLVWIESQHQLGKSDGISNPRALVRRCSKPKDGEFILSRWLARDREFHAADSRSRTSAVERPPGSSFRWLSSLSEICAFAQAYNSGLY